MVASVDMFGGRDLERLFADGLSEPSARGRHCCGVSSWFFWVIWRALGWVVVVVVVFVGGKVGRYG